MIHHDRQHRQEKKWKKGNNSNRDNKENKMTTKKKNINNENFPKNIYHKINIYIHIYPELF